MIIVISCFLVQNMIKIRRMNIELQLVSSKLDSTLVALNQLTAQIGSISKKRTDLITSLEGKFLSSLTFFPEKASIKYQANVNGDKVSLIKNTQPFNGRVTIFTRDKGALN